MIDFITRRIRRLSRRALAFSGLLPASGKPLAPRSASEIVHTERPVFVLPGLSPRRHTEVLEKRLVRDGFLVCPMHIGGVFDLIQGRDIEEMAEALDFAVERIQLDYGLERFGLLALDVAGLVAAYYVKRLGGDENCVSLVTLQTPFGGLPWVPSRIPKGIFFRAARQVSVGSSFLRRLSVGNFPTGVHVASVYSRRSARCPYPAACLSEDAGENACNVEVEAPTLEALLTGKASRRAICHELVRGFECAEKKEGGEDARKCREEKESDK